MILEILFKVDHWPWVRFFSKSKKKGFWTLNDIQQTVLYSDVNHTLEFPEISMYGARLLYYFLGTKHIVLINMLLLVGCAFVMERLRSVTLVLQHELTSTNIIINRIAKLKFNTILMQIKKCFKWDTMIQEIQKRGVLSGTPWFKKFRKAALSMKQSELELDIYYRHFWHLVTFKFTCFICIHICT